LDAVADCASNDLRRREHCSPGWTFDLPGPESMTLDDLVRLLNRDQAVPIRHVPAPLARLLPFVVRDLPRALVDVMLGDCVGDPTQVRRSLISR
jgi:NAD(P)H dehydrogenase (quinone)